MVLVTGGTGLLGSHLLYDLMAKGIRVKALKRPGSNTSLTRATFSFYTGEAKSLFNEIEWVAGDVLDIYALEEAMDGVEEVYHCAAMVSFNPASGRNMMQVNAGGTANMVNAALEKGVHKFCNVSSIAALGRATARGEVVTEQTEFMDSADNSKYSVSKYEAEKEVWRGIAEGLNAVIINPSVIIGPGDWRRGSASIFFKVWQGLKYYTSGVNGFVDVRDVSKAMIGLMENDIRNERFIVSSENCPYKMVFDLIAEELGKNKATRHAGMLLSEMAWRAESIRAALTGSKPLITKETARIANREYHYSNKKIKDAIGIEFIPIEQSVRETAAIFRELFGNRSIATVIA